jgi:hypothetical protein
VREADGLLSLLTDKIDEEVLEAGKNLRVISIESDVHGKTQDN